jgi:predicted lipoprotein with Yx(FWY)xxD motif
MNEASTDRELPSEARRPSPWRRAAWSISGLLAIGTMAAACGSNSGSASTTTTAPTGTGTGATTASVGTTTNASLGTILVNSKGFTLYRLDKDSINKSVCTGACAQTWPPLLTSGSPVAGSGVTGLGTIKVSGGEQVTYHGMPLYTFTGDTSPGQVSGQAVKDTWGTWFVVATKAPPGGSTTTTAGGGGGPAF